MQTDSWILKQFCSFAIQNSTDIPSWLLLSSCLVTRSSGYFLIRKKFCWFPAFLGFRFLPYTLIFYKQHFFFSTQPWCSLTFLWNFLRTVNSAAKFLKKYWQNNIGLYSASKLEGRLFQNYIYDRSLNIFIFRFRNHMRSFGCAPEIGYATMKIRSIKKTILQNCSHP